MMNNDCYRGSWTKVLRGKPTQEANSNCTSYLPRHNKLLYNLLVKMKHIFIILQFLEVGNVGALSWPSGSGSLRNCH